jgi:general stress protein 26
MKFKPQTSAALRELATRLDGQRVAMLTLCDDSNRLVSQPMTPQEMDAHGAIWILLRRDGAAAGRIGARSLSANLAFSDERRATYVSITGHATLTDDAVRKQELWSAVVRPWFPGGAEDPQLVLLRLEPEHAEIWDGPSSSTVRALVMRDVAP